MSTKLPSHTIRSASDNAEPQATITHYDLTKIQVCVPADWTEANILEFAELTWNCVPNHHWITKQYENCGLHSHFIHVNLQAEIYDPAHDSTPERTPIQIEPTPVQARVIIGIESATDHEIKRTADSLQLLVDYLRLRAAAIHARENETTSTNAEQYEIQAHQRHMQLLALFPGTLMFIDRPVPINSEAVHSS